MGDGETEAWKVRQRVLREHHPSLDSTSLPLSELEMAAHQEV